ncbi:C-type lectin domain family 17, member A-like [Poecilia latipinna]|nr:PREDICTED: C-type lectin domain family 17, member A-like [Poecilia formosa]XP_014910601.1 PREDICTED: C-type lectin domain family 17, member A-like [Poecilia latipinna]
MSSCYAYNNYKPPNQRTWEEAREDCRRKNSDLTVVSNQTEKDHVNTQSPSEEGINGYWIGLRAVEGTWKWIDGSNLTDQTWIQQQAATDGYCVTSLNGRGWNTAICGDKNAWICEKKALSV